jgi:hypothetical protein
MPLMDRDGIWPAPTIDLVKNACKQFDEENAIVEKALEELFGQFPRNDSPSRVLLKVVALNRLYSTNILAVYDVAQHIAQHAADIDPALSIGSPEIVDRIGKVTISVTGKQRTNYSFATKYCSWHNRAAYPIWDSRVDWYLRSLKNSPFAARIGTNPHLWEHYAEFLRTMTAFREFFGLQSFSFKEIDKFLWRYGVKPTALPTTEG